MIQLLGLGLGLLSAGMSYSAAKDNARAAQKSMTAQAKVDEAGRMATANSLIAQTRSQNYKVQELKRSVDIMRLQGEADAMINLEQYNDTMATAMVMGAASGRVMGVGSTKAIMDKSESDFMWDQMWAKNNIEIAEAALYQDMANVYEAGATSLMLGAEQLGVQRQASQAGLGNQERQAQLSFNNSMTNLGTSFITNYGASGITSLLDIGKGK